MSETSIGEHRDEPSVRGPADRVTASLEIANDAVGRGFAWLTLPCVFVAFAVVILRYVFGIGYAWMQELYVWLHAIVFTGCAAFALQHDVHVRVDVFYGRMSPRGKAWVDLLGATLLVVPWMIVTIRLTWPWVLNSWRSGETSGSTDGMPGLYVIKAMLPLMAVLLTLQALTMTSRSIAVLCRR
ncbi:MAG: TRAP transporter small permease subunit [Burkholderiaceae bacterium]|jgi:TRAP-type mannitol/chloroaromatic compound transport system permease small subunit|nr:TRAP transporter small permease subunit [Burkholderiaceae bacterium]